MSSAEFSFDSVRGWHVDFTAIPRERWAGMRIALTTWLGLLETQKPTDKVICTDFTLPPIGGEVI